MPSITLRKFVFITLVFIASLWLLWLFDEGLGLGWPSNTLRNWQQYGLTTMHGALIFNAGGFEAVTAPQIYHGMSPVYLYTVFFSTQLLGWTGLGTLSFHLILSLLVLWGIWSLLGKNNFALLVAAVVILCPGYACWQKILDPNVIAVLLGIPYAAFVTTRLQKPRLQAMDILGLVLLTALFVPLNWTTAWMLAPFGVFLLASAQVRRPVVVKFLGLAAAGSILFVASSVLAKSGASGAGGRFLGGYTWGNYGYGTGLTTSRAFVRIFFVTTVSLLPLLCTWGVAAFHKKNFDLKKLLIALLPLSVTVLEIAVMRNYFGHHPWMAAPLIIVGLVFSFALIFESGTQAKSESDGGLELNRLAMIAVGCFVYGLAVISFYRVNNSENLALMHLVRHETARTDWIVVVKNLDPATAQLASHLDDMLDRHVVLVDDLKDLPSGPPLVILTTNPIPGGQLIVEEQSGSTVGFNASLQKAADWFKRNIAHRTPGDRVELTSHYYLYRPAALN